MRRTTERSAWKRFGRLQRAALDYPWADVPEDALALGTCTALLYVRPNGRIGHVLLGDRKPIDLDAVIAEGMLEGLA